MICSFLMVGNQPWAPAMVRSVRRVHSCHIVQMSDLKTPEVPGVDEVVRLPFRIPLMLYRLKHLASFPHDEMLILDADVVAKAHDILSEDWDVALTKRPMEEAFGMPYNTGVMISRSRTFWVEALEWLNDAPKTLHDWYGDQTAVARIAATGRHRIKELSCAEFNWSPNSRRDTSDARFWHYKGLTRKKWLGELCAGL